MKTYLVLIVTFMSLGALADFGAYRLPITRDRQTKTMVAYNIWSGEYPGPVINITEDLKVVGYKSLRILKDKVSCTVKRGLYHPWAPSPSLINFHTLTDVQTYTATRVVQLQDSFIFDDNGTAITELRTGDSVTNIIYLSEGYCSGKMVSAKGKKIVFDFYCDEIISNEGLANKTPLANYKNDEQWLNLKCVNGVEAFISDQDLLATPGVTEGAITGYGEVSE